MKKNGKSSHQRRVTQFIFLPALALGIIVACSKTPEERGKELAEKKIGLVKGIAEGLKATNAEPFSAPRPVQGVDGKKDTSANGVSVYLVASGATDSHLLLRTHNKQPLPGHSENPRWQRHLRVFRLRPTGQAQRSRILYPGQGPVKQAPSRHSHRPLAQRWTCPTPARNPAPRGRPSPRADSSGTRTPCQP